MYRINCSSQPLNSSVTQFFQEGPLHLHNAQTNFPILDDNNTYVKECVKQYPDLFRALYIADPSKPERAAQEIAELDKSVFILFPFLSFNSKSIFEACFNCKAPFGDLQDKVPKCLP